MSSPSFKTVHASVRPARVAILVDAADPEWRHTCLRVVEFYSRLWGGAYNIIVPTDGVRIDDRFWTLLESFDPDYIFYYQTTLSDLALRDANRYREILESHVDKFVAQSNGDRDLARREIDSRLRDARTSRFAVSTALQEELKQRLAPFWFKNWVVDAQSITAGTAPPFHVTDVTKIIGNTEHPDRIGVLQVADTLLPRLWYGAATGLLNSATTLAFEQIGIRGQEITFQEDNISQLIDFAIGSDFPSFVASPGSSATNDLNIVPFRVSMLQLGLYRSVRYEYWRERVVVVLGDTLQDFCLYYCLSRMRDRVVWVLPSISEKIVSDTDTKVDRTELSFLLRLSRAGLRSSRSEGGWIA
jgi:hypothetical protein